MAGATAARGEDAGGGEHAVHVVGLGLVADEDDVAPLPSPPLGEVGVEGHDADRSAGRHVEALGDRRPVGEGLGGELGVEEEVDLVGRDPSDGLGARDQLLAGHLDGDPDRGLGGALAGARLQHPERAVLDGELHVLHVAVVALEAPGDGLELLGRRGEVLAELLDRLGLTVAGHDVLALGVEEVVALERRFPRGRVARHQHAGAGVRPRVPEHHGDDVDRGAEVVGDLRRPPVVEGPPAVPAVEHRLGGQAELVVGILGERRGRAGGDVGAEGVDRGPQRLGGQVGVVDHAVLAAVRAQDLLERVAVHAEHDGGEHLHQAPMGVQHEALVAGAGDHRRGDLVVHADVQDGVHHPRHRELGPRPHRDQQRVVGAAVGLARALLHGTHLGEHLVPEAVGEGAVAGDEGVARLGRDGEPGWDGDAQRGHVGEVGALAPEQPADPVPVAVHGLLRGVDLTEPVHPARHGSVSSPCQPGRWSGSPK